MEIGYFRERAGLTVEQMADRMGVEFSTAYKWDRGIIVPRTQRIPKLAKVLQCSILDLYGETKDGHPTE